MHDGKQSDHLYRGADISLKTIASQLEEYRLKPVHKFSIVDEGFSP